MMVEMVWLCETITSFTQAFGSGPAHAGSSQVHRVNA